jgi:MFS family permease
MLTSWGIEMEVLILGWYILTETGSVLLLTVYSSLQYSGTLIAPLFGMAGDRFGHRTILCGMRFTYAVLAAILMVLAFSGVMQNDQLMAAMGVARTTADSARIFGSLAGASLVAWLGIGPAYVAVTIFYACGLGLTGMITRRRPGSPASTRGGLAFLKEVWEGVSYVRHRPLEMAGIWVAFLVNLLAFPVTVGLLPYVAREIYHTNQTGLGTMVASFAVGGCVGSLTIGFIGHSLRPARMMMICGSLWFALLLMFVQIPYPAAGRFTLLLAGLAQSLSMVPLSTMLLKSAGPKYRGRVMGVRMLAIYGLPIGLLVAGVLIPSIGFPATASIYCVLGLAFMGLIGLRWRDSLWPLDAVGNQR